MPRSHGEPINISLNAKRKELLDDYLPGQPLETKVLSIIDDFFKYELDLKDQLAVILDREFGGQREQNQWCCPVCDELLTFRYEVKNQEVAQRWRSKLYDRYTGAIYVQAERESAYPRDKIHTFLVGYMTGYECPHCKTEIAVSEVDADNEYARYRPCSTSCVKKYILDNVLKAIQSFISSVVSETDPRFTNRHMHKYYIEKIMNHFKSKLEYSSHFVDTNGDETNTFELDEYDVYTEACVQSELERLIQALRGIDRTYLDKHVPFDPDRLGGNYRRDVERDARRLAAGKPLNDELDEDDLEVFGRL